MAISFFCSCHHNCSIIFLSWSSWLGCRVSRWGRYFTCSWEPCEYIFERVHLELLNSVYLGTISVLILYFLAISTTHFWLIPKLMKSNWTTSTTEKESDEDDDSGYVEPTDAAQLKPDRNSSVTTAARVENLHEHGWRRGRGWVWMQRAWTCSQRVVDVDVDVEVVDKGEEMTML